MLSSQLRTAASALATALAIVVCVAAPTRAQIVTVAEIGDTHLFDPARANGDIARQELLENHHAFVSAILSINMLAAAGTRFDAIAFTGGFGINALTLDEVDARAADTSRLLAALLVRRLLILASESDVGVDGSMTLYDRFISGLRKGLPGFEVVNLEQDAVVVSGVQLVGLSSVPMMAWASTPVSSNRQVAALDALDRKLTPGRQAIVFTHVPPIDATRTDLNGKTAGEGWTLTLVAASAWQRIVSRADILAVLAAHRRVADRARYGKAESLLNDPPTEGWPARLWIAPPLSGPASSPRTEPLGGFLEATVTSNGIASGKIHWLSSLETAAPTVSAPIFKGREYEKAWELDKAVAAYEEVLKSNDRDEQAEAQRGFARARSQMNSWRWWLVEQNGPVRFLFDHAELAVAVFVAIFLLLAVSYANPVPLIDPPTKLTSSAPADLFMAEFFAAADEIRDTLKVEQERQLFATPNAMFLVRPNAIDLEPLLKDLPAISGININTLVATIRKYVRWFRRRLELQIAGTDENTKAFGILWHGNNTELSWMEPGNGDSDNDVVAVARRMAYNVMWELRNQ